MTINGHGRARLAGANAELFRQQAFIDGTWCSASNGKVFTVTDPASGQEIGTAPDMGEIDARRALSTAAKAQPDWARWTAFERGACLRDWGDRMRANRETLARLMTREQGKPLNEARGEIDYAAGFLHWFAEQGERNDGEMISSHLPNRRMFSFRAPIGVTAAITPWNFPSAMITRKAGAALAAGCAMIVRPASETPFSALALAALAQESGIPPGVFSVVTGDGATIARAFMDDPRVRHVSFTGSTEVGKMLAAQSAKTMKKVAMELGGHAPVIVCEDVQVDEAVKAVVDAKFQTSGQDCLAANRIYVARAIYAEFCSRYAAAVGALKVGNGFADGTDIGPLISANAVNRCAEQVRDAIARGATLLVGGTSGIPGPNFYSPTAIAGLTSQMKIAREETFGPVAALAPFDSDDQVIEFANDSEFGLAAYLFGRDIARLWRLGERLEYGMIAFNTVKMTGPPVPFGGIKQSGLGREGSRHGIEEYCEIKYFCVNGL